MSGFGWKGVELGPGGSLPFGWHKPSVVNPPNQAPILISAPNIFPSGNQVIGTTFTSSNGTWFATRPLTFEYRWTRNGVPILGATSQTYISVIADEGQTLRCEVRATNAFGVSSYIASSNSSTGVSLPVNTVAPTLSPSGTQGTGTVITLGNGTWTGTAPITFEYRWTRNNVVIAGQTSNTYTIVAGDDGTVIKGEVRGVNVAGTSAYVVTSNQVNAVDAVPLVWGTASLQNWGTATLENWG
jgi:hypothetical protein